MAQQRKIELDIIEKEYQNNLSVIKKVYGQHNCLVTSLEEYKPQIIDIIEKQILSFNGNKVTEGDAKKTVKRKIRKFFY